MIALALTGNVKTSLNHEMWVQRAFLYKSQAFLCIIQLVSKSQMRNTNFSEKFKHLGQSIFWIKMHVILSLIDVQWSCAIRLSYKYCAWKHVSRVELRRPIFHERLCRILVNDDWSEKLFRAYNWNTCYERGRCISMRDTTWMNSYLRIYGCNKPPSAAVKCESAFKLIPARIQSEQRRRKRVSTWGIKLRPRLARACLFRLGTGSKRNKKSFLSDFLSGNSKNNWMHNENCFGTHRFARNTRFSK